MRIAHKTVFCDIEYRSFRVFVDRDDDIRSFHADKVLYGAGNTAGDVIIEAGHDTTDGKVRIQTVSGQDVESVGANAILIPGTFYSAAGTTLPACGATTLGRSWVSDATVATPGTAYTSGGTFTIAVQCIFNSTGSVYSWIVD